MPWTSVSAASRATSMCTSLGGFSRRTIRNIVRFLQSPPLVVALETTSRRDRRNRPTRPSECARSWENAATSWKTIPKTTRRRIYARSQLLLTASLTYRQERTTQIFNRRCIIESAQWLLILCSSESCFELTHRFRRRRAVRALSAGLPTPHRSGPKVSGKSGDPRSSGRRGQENRAERIGNLCRT
jgi:hypothetical protein